MAKNCALCNKSMGFFDSGAFVLDKYSICESCNSLFNRTEDATNLDEGFESTIKSFKKEFASSPLLAEFVDYFESQHEAYLAIRNSDGEYKDIRDAEENRKQMDEAIKERRKKEAVAQRKAKIDSLAQKGYEGYYEYKVVSLFDQSDSGRIASGDIEDTLNQLGIEGWHLKCAYANEVGKNSSSSGVGGYSTGTNATIDQNILIFERFVKIK